ncbi:ROK family protein [Microbacterium sp. NPDC058345]|uniref:ROK family protein n=1 Tax=Microbacterium sp. NPDC058345 TaxID=3346455 RepID=UPI00365A56CD
MSTPGSGLRIGLDVGGTKIAGVALTPHGEIVARTRRATGWGGQAVVQGIVTAAQELAAQAGSSAGGIRSVGVGIPGLVDADAGRVLHAVNLGVESLDVGPRVSEQLGVPCHVENDVKAAALGAAALRGGGDEPMAYLNIGTGVAAGIVIGGRIWRGARGTAGEVGHLVVEPGGRVCGCGQRGCIETLCGGGAIARAWGRAADLPVKDVLDAADAGDEVAAALRADIARGVSAAVRVLVLTADVETVVIGGGLTALADRLEPRIRQALRDDARESAFLRSLHLDERIELLPATSPVSAIGAALLGPDSSPHTPLDKEIIVHG